MKTLHNTNTQNLYRIRERVRMGMTLAGIATAIICSVALFYEMPFMPREVSLPRVETPNGGAVNLPTVAIGKSVVSAIWPF